MGSMIILFAVMFTLPRLRARMAEPHKYGRPRTKITIALRRCGLSILLLTGLQETAAQNPDYIPPTGMGGLSPQHASFINHHDVNAIPAASGTFSTAIPIGSVTHNGITIPITLTYDSNIRLTTDASWVGMGFNLGVGMITREVAGVPDEMHPGLFYTTYNLEGHAPGPAPGSVAVYGVEFILGQWHRTTQDVSYDIHDPQSLATSLNEGWDHYTLSMPGRSTQLVATYQQTLEFLPADWSALKISYQYNPSFEDTIESFRVIDEHGNIYYYGGPGATDYITITQPRPTTGDLYFKFANAWHLSMVCPPQTAHDTYFGTVEHCIHIYYDRRQTNDPLQEGALDYWSTKSVQIGPNAYGTADQYPTGRSPGRCKQEQETTMGVPTIFHHYKCELAHVLYDHSYISRIATPNSKFIFNTSDRTDSISDNGKYPKSLDSITRYVIHNNGIQTPIREHRFTYAAANANYSTPEWTQGERLRNRHTLLSVQEVAITQADQVIIDEIILPPYQFEYLYNPNLLQAGLQNEVWALEHPEIYQILGLGVLRSSYPALPGSWSLHKLKYPEGGQLTINYESGLASWAPDIFGGVRYLGQPKPAGGARVSQTLWSPDDGLTTLETHYSYGEGVIEDNPATMQPPHRSQLINHSTFINNNVYYRSITRSHLSRIAYDEPQSVIHHGSSKEYYVTNTPNNCANLPTQPPEPFDSRECRPSQYQYYTGDHSWLIRVFQHNPGIRGRIWKEERYNQNGQLVYERNTYFKRRAVRGLFSSESEPKFLQASWQTLPEVVTESTDGFSRRTRNTYNVRNGLPSRVDISEWDGDAWMPLGSSGFRYAFEVYAPMSARNMLTGLYSKSQLVPGLHTLQAYSQDIIRWGEFGGGWQPSEVLRWRNSDGPAVPSIDLFPEQWHHEAIFHSYEGNRPKEFFANDVGMVHKEYDPHTHRLISEAVVPVPRRTEPTSSPSSPPYPIFATDVYYESQFNTFDPNYWNGLFDHSLVNIDNGLTIFPASESNWVFVESVLHRTAPRSFEVDFVLDSLNVRGGLAVFPVIPDGTGGTIFDNAAIVVEINSNALGVRYRSTGGSMTDDVFTYPFDLYETYRLSLRADPVSGSFFVDLDGAAVIEGATSFAAPSGNNGIFSFVLYTSQFDVFGREHGPIRFTSVTEHIAEVDTPIQHEASSYSVLIDAFGHYGEGSANTLGSTFGLNWQGVSGSHPANHGVWDSSLMIAAAPSSSSFSTSSGVQRAVATDADYALSARFLLGTDYSQLEVGLYGSDEGSPSIPNEYVFIRPGVVDVYVDGSMSSIPASVVANRTHWIRLECTDGGLSVLLLDGQPIHHRAGCEPESAASLRLFARLIDGGGGGYNDHVEIQEVRFHPLRALAFSLAYTSRGEIESISNHNVVVGQRFEYDSMSRLLSSFDAEDRLVASFDYYMSGADPLHPHPVPLNILTSQSHYSDTKAITNYDYFDGSSALFQRYALVDHGSGAVGDSLIVTLLDGDPSGLLRRSWNPVGVRRPSGSGATSAFVASDQIRSMVMSTFENAIGNGVGAWNRPFIEYGYEASPLRRPELVRGPGADAATGVGFAAGSSQTTSYGVAVPVAGHSALPFVQSLDEDGRWTRSFTDGLGRTRFVVRGSLHSGETSTTGMVYDGAGRLVRVRPPHYYSPPPQSSPTDWESVYTYDSRGLLLSKTTPDTRSPDHMDSGQHRYKYDLSGRLRYSQTPQQRAHGEVSFNLYDDLHRLVGAGVGRPISCSSKHGGDGEYCWAGLDPDWDLTHVPGDPQGIHLDVSATNCLSTAPSGQEALCHWENRSVNQRSVWVFDSPYWGVHTAGGGASIGALPSTLGLSERGRLITPGDTTFSFRWSAGAMVAQAHRTDGLWSVPGARWQTSVFSYDVFGNPDRRWTHTDGVALAWERFGYAYDRQGRVTSDTVRVGSYALAHFYDYDRRGQLAEVRAWAGSGPVTRPSSPDVSYGYDVAGAVTARTLAVIGLGPLARTYDVAGRLHALGDLGGTQPFAARYSYTPGGLISRIEHHTPWSVHGCPYSPSINPWDPVPEPDSDACAARWRYDFTYDALARLQQSIFVPHNGSHQQGQYYSTGVIDYDLQGNITSLTRWAPTAASPHGQWVDALTYTYAPGTNRLSAVADAMGGLYDWDAKPSQFQYDHNGAMTEQRETLPDGRTARLRVTRLDERGLPERLEQITYAGAPPGALAERDHTAYAYDASGQRILKRTWTGSASGAGLPGQGDPVYAVERYVRDGQRLVGAFDGEGTLLWWTLGGAAGLEGRLVPQSGGPIIIGPKALAESEQRLATETDSVLVGALVAVGLDGSSAEAVAALAAPSVVYAAQQAASGSVEAAGEGAALGLTDAGGREQYGQTQGAITEALRLALLAEGYDALAADTLSHRAGMEASVALAQVVGSAVGDSKDGEAPGGPGGGLTYGRRYYVSDHLGSVRAVVTTSGQVVEARDYYAYGLMMPGRTFTAGQETREGYTGHELDAETGMYYAGARYYMPVLGRWTAVDPLVADYPGQSPYNYALNNPLSFTDPTGMCPEDGSAGPNQFGPGECLPEVVVTARHPDRPTVGQAIAGGFVATLPVAGGVALADSPVPGPADVIAVGVQIVGTVIVAHSIYSNWQSPPNVVLPPSGIVLSATFPSAKEMARRLGVSVETWHREIKPEIVSHHGREAQSIGANNPDVGVNAEGNIVLRNPQTGRTAETETPLKSYE